MLNELAIGFSTIFKIDIDAFVNKQSQKFSLYIPSFLYICNDCFEGMFGGVSLSCFYYYLGGVFFYHRIKKKNVASAFYHFEREKKLVRGVLFFQML